MINDVLTHFPLCVKKNPLKVYDTVLNVFNFLGTSNREIKRKRYVCANL